MMSVAYFWVNLIQLVDNGGPRGFDLLPWGTNIYTVLVQIWINMERLKLLK